MPLTSEPDALYVVDTGWNIDLDGALLQQAAAAVAGAARRFDHASCPFAARADAGAHELAEHALGHLLHPSVAAAGDTRGWARARLGAVASTGLAGARDSDADRH